MNVSGRSLIKEQYTICVCTCSVSELTINLSYQPFKGNGENAHWALIKGAVFPSENGASDWFALAVQCIVGLW